MTEAIWMIKSGVIDVYLPPMNVRVLVRQSFSRPLKSLAASVQSSRISSYRSVLIMFEA